MAKFQVGNGIDQYVEMLQNLEFTAHDSIGRAIYKGAAIVADAVKANIRTLPASSCSSQEKAALIEGLGIAKMRDDGGYWNVKIGFDGYDNVKTKSYPKGRPISMIARSIESGTSFRTKHPFVAPAVNATRAVAEMAMAEEINKELAQKTQGL